MKQLKVLFVVLGLLLIIPLVIANTAEDFESYAPGTLAEDLTTAGVTYSGSGAFEIVDTGGFLLSGQILFGDCLSPLTMTFDSPQTSISFDYAVAQNPLRVTAFSNGSQVAQQDFNGTTRNGTPQGSASLTVTFDEIVVSAPSQPDCLAIDNLVTTSTAVVGAYVPLDSRINRFDGAAPVAVYANSQGGIDIYTISGDSGTFALRVNDLADAPCGEIVETVDGIIVSRTSDCLYQVNAPQYNGKTYILIFEAIRSDTEYRSFEE